jgi:hypothetical protein
VHFFGNDRIVYRLDGYTPMRISTHAIEYHLRNVTDAWAFVYTQEGHKFYCLCTDQGTWCYDMATGAWHERKSTGRDNYRVGFAEIAWGEPVLADNDNGRLYRPDLDTYDEDGDLISMRGRAADTGSIARAGHDVRLRGLLRDGRRAEFRPRLRSADHVALFGQWRPDLLQ